MARSSPAPGSARSRRGPGTRRWPRRRRARPRARRGGARFLGGSAGPGADSEDRMVRRDRAELVVGGVRSDAPEELADLPLPAREIRAQDGGLVVVGHLSGGEVLPPLTPEQAPLAPDAEVSHPLRVSTWRDEIAIPLQIQRIDRCAMRVAGLSPPDLQHAGPGEGQAEPGQAGDEGVEHMGGEPARALKVLRDDAIVPG